MDSTCTTLILFWEARREALVIYFPFRISFFVVNIANINISFFLSVYNVIDFFFFVFYESWAAGPRARVMLRGNQYYM